jgi:hypothetical protein
MPYRIRTARAPLCRHIAEDNPHAYRRSPPRPHRLETIATVTQPGPAPRRPFHDEMADFDRDMERDEAADQQRKRELIRQWLAPQKGRCQ